MHKRMVPMTEYPRSVAALPDTDAARDALQALLFKVHEDPQAWPQVPDSESRVARSYPHAGLPELRLYYRIDGSEIYLCYAETSPEGAPGS
jgi:hypothetical protein